MLLSLWIYKRKRTTSFYIGIVSVILIIATLLITLLVLVPIDNDIKVWTAATIPVDFEAIRHTWKTYHAIRTFLSLASFLCFSLFVLSDSAIGFRKT